MHRRRLENKELLVEESKRCGTCNIIFPLSEFNRRKNRETDNGIKKYASDCRRCNVLRCYVSKYKIEKEHVFAAAKIKTCGICGVDATSSRNVGRRSLSIDHNHDTNKIRGVLCHSCNVGLGHFKDKIEWLEQAIAYLRNSND